MENLDRRMLLAGLGLVGAAAAASAASAGTLNPPAGPVAPTGKTTDEIEPRVAVESLAGDATSLYLINLPGSYHLTGNINGVAGKAAIAIAADNVTLDLGGFALIGVLGATLGVELRPPRKQIVVRNGSIRGFLTGGIVALSTGVNGSRIEGVSVTDILVGNGIQFSGTGNRVRGCEVNTIGGSGIVLGGSTLAEDCVVFGCQATQTVFGISALTVVGCTVSTIASSTQAAEGISADTASNCSVDDVSGTTVSAGVVAVSASNCAIRFIGSGAGDVGASIGVNASTASNCAVTSVGAASSTTAPVGIISRTTQNCDVNFVGDVASAVGATGISGTEISHCNVGNVRGGTSGAVTGISAFMVSHCRVGSLSQGVSSGGVTGISGTDAVVACSVEGISGATSFPTTGISSGGVVRECFVNLVSNTGAGAASGLNRTSPQIGNVENCVFRNCGDVAVSVNAHQRIVGCQVFSTTTGILATGVGNVIEGNSVDTCTIGISVMSGANTAQALVVRNQVRNCTTNFVLDAPCQSGPAVNAVGTIASTNPWANFTD